MHPVLAVILVSLALAGHVVLWVMLVNRLHAYAWRRWLIDGLTVLSGVALLAVPLVIAVIYWQRQATFAAGPWNGQLWLVWFAIVAHALLLMFAIYRHFALLWHPEHKSRVVANHTTIVDVRELTDAPLTAPGIPTLLARLPKNQVVQPHFQEKRIALPGWKPLADSTIKIVHLTDFHMSGRITKEYFLHVIERVNEWKPDIVALTGDLVEKEPCLEWIGDTYGQLQAEHSVYFVLGNHDRHVDSHDLRNRLVETGLIDAAGALINVEVAGVPVAIGGNELPWFASASDYSKSPQHDQHGQPLRIVLSHSPDQFVWAQRNAVDLILAGHCHGGQVQFPLVGAILAPSVYGTRYVEGAFRAKNTILHVSRGVSGLAPFRWNCPPEVSLLTLCAASSND